ncbi:putative amidoligase enzyme-domain-containing protein [Annulohypoxylon bovei var. microspora]|nr:putative amidoligase enzyme-domain-containing protein [Annulohypoxylon bovei var. microspora]
MTTLTFGVELEAAYFYTRRHDQLDGIRESIAGLAPVVDMTYETFKRRNPKAPRCSHLSQVERDSDMERLVAWEIHDFVDNLPQSSRGELIPLTGNPLQDSYREWKIEGDLSIKLNEEDHGDLEFTGLEVISPAMFATESAFREVKAVTEMLRQTFRAAVPPSCGLHVHVGQGPDYFPFETLQKLAAVCWAGDLLFQQMHPVSRRSNDHCLGLRIKSNLAYGDKAEQHSTPNDDLSGGDVKKLLSSTVLSGWEAGAQHLIAAAKPAVSIQEHINRGRPKRLTTTFNRTLLRSEHAVMPSPEELDICGIPAYGVILPDEPFEPLEGADIMTGATELFRCLNYYAVATLMSTGGRGAYNFENYGDIKKHAEKSKESTNKTIEFRQAAGSLDGHWVATYARICVGIARFAQNAKMPDLWRLIYECHHAEKYKDQYDVLDLLQDLDLASEAKVIQSRLKTGAHVAEMLRPFLSGVDCLACNHLHELMCKCGQS